MPRLTVQGTLTDRGQATPFSVPLKVTLTLSRDDTDYRYSDVLDIVCPAGGAFAAEFTVSSEVTAKFTTSGESGSGSGAAGGHVTVTIAPYAPGATPFTYTSPVLAFFTRDQTFLGVAETLVDALVVDVNLNGVAHYTFTAVIRSDDDVTLDAFADVDQLLCEVLRDRVVANPAARIVAAPGKDGAPPDPKVEAAVDAFNDAISGGPDQGQSMEEWEADLQDLIQDVENAASPSPAPGAGEYSILTTAPALRDGDLYRAHVLVRQRDLPGHTFFVRFRSQGPDFNGKLVLRSPRLPVTWPRDNYGLMTRVERPTGVGTISTMLPDRTFKSPFVLIDPDLDFVDGGLRVRGRVGVGTGANMVIAQVASIDVTLTLTLVSYENKPFSMSELDNFFDLRVTKTKVDLLPGTDLDELPAWLWLAIGVVGFPLGLSSAALSVALVAAIELALKPVVGTMVRAQTISRLTARVKQDVNNEIDNQLEDSAADFGAELPAETVAQLRAGAWFQTEQLTVDADAATVTAFGGVWHVLAGQVNSECPLRSSTARRSVDLNSARTFEQAVSRPELADWMRRYNEHRPEIRRMLLTKPKVLAKLAAFIRAHHGTAAGGTTTVVPAGLVTDWLALTAAARPAASPELARLLTDLDAVMQASSKRTVTEARRIAAERSRTPAAARK
jgi:hypothetical protein